MSVLNIDFPFFKTLFHFYCSGSEYYEYGHGTNDDAYNNYGKGRFLL